ncbi:hypothetical protein VP150E351_P0107 [Vibrio phage 150E35-1]|nr:hypothetical protein VP150E351_P0107 [Vibrio phage 150E35-1]
MPDYLLYLGLPESALTTRKFPKRELLGRSRSRFTGNRTRVLLCTKQRIQPLRPC